jgi:hypothetical protein
MPSPADPPDSRGTPEPSTGRGASTAVDARSNGHGAGHGVPAGPGRAATSRRPPGPSTKPALIVVGIIFVLFLAGIVLELLSGSQSRPTASPTKIATARGAVLQAVPARPLLGAITTAGQPPDDLLDALAVPKGATPLPTSANDRGVELYDRSLQFTVAATQQDVISFFGAQLPSQHWRRLSQGATGTAGTAFLILEQHPASDGHEWDVGVTVSPTVFGATSSASGTTTFTLRLYSVSDQD